MGENTNQEVIDIILGKSGTSDRTYDTNTKLQNFINVELFKQESLFTTIDFLKVNVSSWNIGGVKPMEEMDIRKWLFPFEQNFLPDIFVIGF